MAPEVLLLYPGEHLESLARRWLRAHRECRLRVSGARSLPAIRRALEGATAVIVDATDDHAQAVDALLQAVARRGSKAVAVYTERMHDGLELFVRMQGALLLLGPINDREWDGFCRPRVQEALAERAATIPMRRPSPASGWPRRAA
jgi:hypothetical protein